jgi:hypothetical protein
MPYRFELGQLEPVYIGVYGDYTVDFDIGVDDDHNEQVVMTVALVEDDNSGSDPFELIFGIRRKSLETEAVSLPEFDHTTARSCVPRENAAAVLDLILDAVSALVDHVNPSTVAMVTYEADLPVAGIAKYTRISNHMGLLGYTQTEYRRDGTDRKDYWLFTK